MIASGFHEHGGGLLLEASATETDLLTHWEQALLSPPVPPDPVPLPLAGFAAVRQRLLLTVLFLYAAEHAARCCTQGARPASRGYEQ